MILRSSHTICLTSHDGSTGRRFDIPRGLRGLRRCARRTIEMSSEANRGPLPKGVTPGAVITEPEGRARYRVPNDRRRHGADALQQPGDSLIEGSEDAGEVGVKLQDDPRRGRWSRRRLDRFVPQGSRRGNASRSWYCVEHHLVQW